MNPSFKLCSVSWIDNRQRRPQLTNEQTADVKFNVKFTKLIDELDACWLTNNMKIRRRVGLYHSLTWQPALHRLLTSKLVNFPTLDQTWLIWKKEMDDKFGRQRTRYLRFIELENFIHFEYSVFCFCHPIVLWQFHFQALLIVCCVWFAWQMSNSRRFFFQPVRVGRDRFSPEQNEKNIFFIIIYWCTFGGDAM